MRKVLDPKRFYKSNDVKDVPKYFQVQLSILSICDNISVDGHIYINKYLLICLEVLKCYFYFLYLSMYIFQQINGFFIDFFSMKKPNSKNVQHTQLMLKHKSLPILPLSSYVFLLLMFCFVFTVWQGG